MPPAQKRSAASKRKPTRTPSRGALVIIDNEPLREEAVSEYLAVEEEIGTVREQLEAFQTRDVPAYERWEATVFGPMLTELRETNSAIEEKRRFLEEIAQEMYWSGCSEVTAYRRVKEARENPEVARERDKAREESEEDGPESAEIPEFNVLPKGFDVDVYDAAPRSVQRQIRKAVEAMAALFEELTGIPAPGFEEILENERAKKHGTRADPTEGGPIRETAPAPDSPDSRVKELYRRLVRLLHPDSSGDHSARARELWHELQEAYRTRDLERMEAVAGRADLGMNGTAAALSVGLLKRMIRDLRDALSGMRSQVARARKNPAWNFRRRGKELPKLEKMRRHALERGLEQAKWTLGDFTRELDRLEKCAARRAQKKTKPAPRPKKNKGKAEPVSRDGVQFEFF